MNEGILFLGPGAADIIQAQIIDAVGAPQALNDDIMESDGITLQQIFFGPYAGPGPGPAVPMDPVAPPTTIIYVPRSRLFEALDVRIFEALDNRIFEA